MSEHDDRERWNDNKRSDGLAILPGIEGFVIMPQAEGLPIDLCPCCKRSLRSERSARLVADMLYPMRRTPGDDDAAA